MYYIESDLSQGISANFREKYQRTAGKKQDLFIELADGGTLSAEKYTYEKKYLRKKTPISQENYHPCSIVHSTLEFNFTVSFIFVFSRH